MIRRPPHWTPLGQEVARRRKTGASFDEALENALFNHGQQHYEQVYNNRAYGDIRALLIADVTCHWPGRDPENVEGVVARIMVTIQDECTYQGGARNTPYLMIEHRKFLAMLASPAISRTTRQEIRHFVRRFWRSEAAIFACLTGPQAREVQRG